VQPSALAGRVLLFDDDCGFCRRTVNWLQRRGALRGTEATAWQFLDPAALPVPPERLDQEVILVDGDTVRGGAAALAGAMAGGTLPWRVTGGLLRAPGVRALAAYVYGHVAANRYRMPGGTAACRIPSAQRH
jgi:predicted DCC family thiol-disulfide oxidoreductase YuxK